MRLRAANGVVHLPEILAEHFGMSRSEARRNIAQGGVRLDGEPVTELEELTLSWLAQQPFLGRAPLAPVASGMAGAVTAVGALAFGTFVAPPAAPSVPATADSITLWGRPNGDFHVDVEYSTDPLFGTSTGPGS